MDKKNVMICVTTDSPEIMTRAAEAFGRVASSLAMEDVPVVIVFNDADDLGGPLGGT